MATCAYILLAVILLFIGSIALRIYMKIRRFRRLLEVQWRTRLENRVAPIVKQLEALKKENEQIETEQRAEMEMEFGPLLERHFASVPIDELLEFSGIGPATIGKLRESGLTRLDQLEEIPSELPGIGQKRMEDLRSAVGQLLREERARFLAEGPPEAQERIERYLENDRPRSQRLAANAESLEQLHRRVIGLAPLADMAQSITFEHYLRFGHVPELPDDILNTPIDELLAASPPEPDDDLGSLVLSHISNALGPRARAKLGISPPEIADRGSSATAKPLDLFRSAMEKSEAAAPLKKDHPRLPHLRIVTEFGFAVARANGKVVKAERSAIRQYLKKAFGHEADLLPWIEPLIEETEKKPRGLNEILIVLSSLFDEKERQSLYRFACDIADAAGKRTAKERRTLQTIADAWALGTAERSESPFARQRAEAKADVAPRPPEKPPSQEKISRDECLSALEIATGAPLTADLIRRQYRQLVERNDPAKFVSHGADFVALAEEKRKKVEQSARRLLDEMGQKLEEDKQPEPPKDARHNPDLDAAFGM